MRWRPGGHYGSKPETTSSGASLLALQDAIPGLIHAIAMLEEERDGSLREVHLVTWQFHALRHKVDNVHVLEAAQILAEAVAGVTDHGASPQRVQAVVPSIRVLPRVDGRVTYFPTPQVYAAHTAARLSGLLAKRPAQGANIQSAGVAIWALRFKK